MPPGAFGSAGGLYSASCVTFIGSLTSIAWKPPECQVLNAMFWVSVGLCAEYEVRGTSGLSTVQIAGIVLRQPEVLAHRGPRRVGDVDEPRPAPRAAVTGAP